MNKGVPTEHMTEFGGHHIIGTITLHIRLTLEETEDILPHGFSNKDYCNKEISKCLSIGTCE